MPFINLPPSLQTMFAGLEARLLKIETAIRFTAPNVSTDPTLPRKGDVIFNTTSNSLKYVDNSGAFIALGASTGVSAVSGTAPIVSSGGLTPAISLSTTGTAGTYTKVTTDTYGRVSSGTTLAAADVPGTLNATTFGGLVTGKTNTGGTVSTSNDTGGLSVRGDNSNAASISFHRPGNYAMNMGLDTDNGFKIGGWSAGATPYFQINTSGHQTLPAQPVWQSDITSASNAYSTFTATQNIGFTATNSSTITVQTAGKYLVVAQQLVSTSGAGYFYLQQNNVSQRWGYISNTSFIDWGIRAILTCAAGDTIRLNMAITLANQWNGGHSSLSIVKVA